MTARRPVVLGALLVLLAYSGAGCASSSRSGFTSSRLAFQVVAKGTGPVAVRGQTVSIHEAVAFTDGRVLYTPRSGPPVRFLLGGGQVIPGVEELVTGMRVGDRRVAVIPPRLSHRTVYPEGLSAEDSLRYDIELIQIEDH